MMASIVYFKRRSMPLHKFYIIFFSIIFLNSHFLKTDYRFYVSNIRVDVKYTSAAQAPAMLPLSF